MATYRKRGKTWRAEVKLQGVRESNTFDTKASAQAWATEREAEILAGKRGQIVARTVCQALERYADSVSPKHRGEQWERVRLGKLARTLPFTGRLLAEVTKADVADWRDGMGKGAPDAEPPVRPLAASSARREYGLLRAVFAVARDEWGWLRVSPFDRLSPPPEGRPRSRRVADDEVERLLLALGYERWKPPETAKQYIALAMLLALHTAMRQGEILSLDAASYRPQARIVHLDKTKNGDERDVPVSKAAAEVLAVASTFPVDSPTFDTLFRRARARSGLLDLHFHDLRREATTRLAAKVDVLTLAKITGHRDLKLLMRTYYAPSMTDVAARLD